MVIKPVLVAGHIEPLVLKHEKPTAKQHLATIRMLFDWLVTGQVIPAYLAHAVRGPKHVAKWQDAGAERRRGPHAPG